MREVIMSQLRCKLFISLLPGLGVLPPGGWSRSVRWAEDLLCWVLTRLRGRVRTCLGPLIPKRKLVFTFTAFSKVLLLDVGRKWSVLWTKSSLYLEVAAIFWLSLDSIKNMEWAIQICEIGHRTACTNTFPSCRVWSRWL